MVPPCRGCGCAITTAPLGSAAIRTVASNLPAGPATHSFLASPMNAHYWQPARTCQLALPDGNPAGIVPLVRPAGDVGR